MMRSIVRTVFAIGLGLTSSVTALAADAVTLPASAKLLTKAEVFDVYEGKSYSWSHPNTDKATGTAKFDLANGRASGLFENGKMKGEWESKIRFKGEQYCWRARVKGQKKYGAEVCNLVYLDGTTTYEVNPKTKRVNSVDKPM